MVWGRLVRVGGEETTQVASKFILAEDVVYFGRVSQIADSTGQFTHKTQNAIPCVYVSSTHFSIAVFYEPVVAGDDNNAKDVSTTTLRAQYRIQDFARNGTFLNGGLIGMKNAMDLKDGDEISLRYKGKILIVYKFQAIATEGADHATVTAPAASPPAPVQGGPQSSPNRRTSGMHSPTPIKPTNVPPQQQPQPTSSATKNLLAESLAQQISVLQEEALASNARINSQSEQINQLQQELEKINKKSKAEEKLKEEAVKEVHELKEQISAMTSNQNALEARTKILHEEKEELEQSVKELKSKVNQLQEEMKDKVNQVEKRTLLLEDSTKALTVEQTLRQQIEEQLLHCQQHVETIEEQNRKQIEVITELQVVKNSLEEKIEEWKKQYEIQTKFIEDLQSKYAEQIHKRSSFCFQQYNNVIEVMKVFDQSMKGWHEQESMMHSFIRDFHIPSAPLPPIASRADIGLSANGLVARQSQHYGGGLNIACTQVPQSPGGAGGLTEGEDEKEEDHHRDNGDEGMLAVDESVIFRESNNNHRNISRRNHTQSKHNNKRGNSTPTTAVQGVPASKRGKALDGTMFPSLILDEEPIIANSGEDGEEAHDMAFDCTQVPFSQVEEQLRDFQENGKKRGRSGDAGDEGDCDGETMMPGIGGSSVGVGLLLGEEDNNTALPLERTASKVSQLEAPFKSEDVKGVSVSHCDFNLLSQDSAVRGSTTSNTTTSGSNNCKSSSGDMGSNQINGGNKKVSHTKKEEVDDAEDDDDESLILTGQSKSKCHNRSKKDSKPDNKKREICPDLDETQDVPRHDDPILGNFDSMMEE